MLIKTGVVRFVTLWNCENKAESSELRLSTVSIDIQSTKQKKKNAWHIKNIHDPFEAINNYLLIWWNKYDSVLFVGTKAKYWTRQQDTGATIHILI